jgi:hypothetical protein
MHVGVTSPFLHGALYYMSCVLPSYREQERKELSYRSSTPITDMSKSRAQNRPVKRSNPIRLLSNAVSKTMLERRRHRASFLAPANDAFRSVPGARTEGISLSACVLVASLFVACPHPRGNRRPSADRPANRTCGCGCACHTRQILRLRSPERSWTHRPENELKGGKQRRSPSRRSHEASKR